MNGRNRAMTCTMNDLIWSPKTVLFGISLSAGKKCSKPSHNIHCLSGSIRGAFVEGPSDTKWVT